jgi:hypothetical protein
VLSGLVRRLGSVPSESAKVIDKIFADLESGQGYPQPGLYVANSAEEDAAVCLHVMRAISRTAGMDSYTGEHALYFLGELLTGESYDNVQEAVRPLRDVGIDGVFEYLDEQIDTRNVIYSILLKYKQHCEWFHRGTLRAIADAGLDGAKGERSLARHLQEYVFNQHVEFVVEPSSSSGEADLILREPGGRYLVIDAKYLPSEAENADIRKKIASGFHQVARYCEDYREPEGFLVSFVRSTKRISLELEESDGLTFLRLGGRTIYYLSVLISDEPPASKSGKAEEVNITRKELVLAAAE